VADDVTITVHVRDLTGPGFQSVNRNLNQLQRQASSMGGSLRIVGGHLDDVASSAANASSSLGGGAGLKGQAIGAAAVLGTTLLPTIGALAPILTGLAVVAGGGALAMDDLKKKAKELKPAFEDWKKVAEKAIAPHTEKAVRSLKGAMKDLTPVIEVGADTFGRITEKAAKFADSPAFKGALAKNAEMGSRWVEEFAGSIGTFTQAFLDFGAKSQPALDAWDSLLGGFLDTGLPKMFDGLEQGISGSSEMLGGLASFINDGLLPALGKVAGSFAEAFGPLIGEMLEAAGQSLNALGTAFEIAMETAEPFAGLLADAFRAMNEVVPIATEVMGVFAKTVGGALFDALMSVVGIDTSQLGNGFRGLSDWVTAHEGQIRGAFFAIAQGITDMVTIGVSMLPQLWAAFRLTTEGVLLAVDGLVSGLAAGLGHLPGGEIFTKMNEDFDRVASGFRDNLDTMGSGIDSFVDEAIPRLGRAKLTMNVEQAKQSLNSIKEKLKDPALTAERKATLKADKSQAEAALRDARSKLDAYDKKQAEARITADARSFFGTASKVNGTRFPGKKVSVGANRSFFDAAVRAISGSVVGTAYINVVQRRVESQNQRKFSANGNLFRTFADGGVEDHTAQIAPAGAWRVWAEPETGGEAYIPLNPSKRPRSRQIAEETVGILGGSVKWYAKGGVTKAEKAARKDAWSDLTISHFGHMAGYQRSEFGSALGKPDSVSSLVNALNQWRSTILKATHGGQERSLLRALDSTGKKLLSWEKQLGKVSASLEKAKDKLDSLKSAAASLSDSVKSGVLNASNITRGGSGDTPVTVASVMGGLTASRDKATAFAQALKDLKSKGLSSSLLQQIAEAGPDGGLDTAGALLQASSSEISSMNSLQSQINSAAGSAGKTTADAVFGAAIKAQQAQVKKLTDSQEKLARSMDKLAKAMEKQIEKAFKKKASGGIIGAASGGLRSGWTMVGEHEPELVRLPFGSRVYSGPDTRRMQQQAWASMLNTPRSGGARYAPTTAATTDGQPLVIQVRIADRDFGEIWVDAGRKAVRARGSIEATLKPPRGR
jgi:hypothetical protein